MSRTAWSAGALALILAGALGAGWVLAPAAADDGPAPLAATAPDAQTTAIVGAAEGFLATLSDDQRAAVQFAWGDAGQRQNWSNLPVDMVPRAGLAWGDLDEDQRAALWALLAQVLSPRGLEMVERQMAADEVLRLDEAGGGPSLTFGSDHYYVSLLGAPSPDHLWTLQFGGHHLALNATVGGDAVTLAPSLTGGQPLRLTVDGAAVWITEAETGAAAALMAALSADQQAVAVQGADSIDLVLGPGEDGTTLDPVGLTGAQMTADQRDLLLALIAARVGLLNADDAAAAMAAIATDLDQTAFAWWGPVDDAARSYWRVTGPGIVLEYAGQSMGGDLADHAHNMWRAPGLDYGAALAVSAD